MHQYLQVGVAEEEVLVTAEVVAVPEASPDAVNIVVLVTSTGPLVEEMVLFPVEDAMLEEFEYDCAEAVPMRAMAMVTNVFFIVLMS